MSIHLLGYSEATISRIMAILVDLDETGEVVIVKNVGVESKIPFCPPSMKYKIMDWSEWRLDPQETMCALAAMKPASRKKIFNFFSENCGVLMQNYTRICHPSAVIDTTVTVDHGCIVEPCSVIASFTTLGFAVYVNRGCTVGHHCEIGAFSSINPGVHIGGHCKIGTGVQIGIGSSVFDHVNIGDHSIIGGGSVVTKDIPAGVVAWGNPCKVQKNISED